VITADEDAARGGAAGPKEMPSWERDERSAVAADKSRSLELSSAQLSSALVSHLVDEK